MDTYEEDALFEDLRALCDDAEALGLEDVALVLEFALDVFLKETGADVMPQAASAADLLERSARAIDHRKVKAPEHLPRIGWSMSSFPLADMARKAS